MANCVEQSGVFGNDRDDRLPSFQVAVRSYETHDVGCFDAPSSLYYIGPCRRASFDTRTTGTNGNIEPS